MAYYAKGLKELIKSTKLNLEFFDTLTEFQLHFLEMCIKKNLDENIGVMNDVEEYNYTLFQEYKLIKFEQEYGLDPDIWKKSA
ncbi:MAG: hypothetical protein N4A33_03610 [Bacteriovoracaceae bacterium]|jgi:hypothetical protein|nr:hypothetical protein [Bacteriovoracaceae bacterium]